MFNICVIVNWFYSVCIIHKVGNITYKAAIQLLSGHLKREMKQGTVVMRCGSIDVDLTVSIFIYLWQKLWLIKYQNNSKMYWLHYNKSITAGQRPPLIPSNCRGFVPVRPTPCQQTSIFNIQMYALVGNRGLNSQRKKQSYFSLLLNNKKWMILLSWYRVAELTIDNNNLQCPIPIRCRSVERVQHFSRCWHLT